MYRHWKFQLNHISIIKTILSEKILKIEREICFLKIFQCIYKVIVNQLLNYLLLPSELVKNF